MNPQTIIKVCGITSLEDGLTALASGADWLGFVRWPKSRRYVEQAEAASLVKQLRSISRNTFEAIGVYIDPDRKLLDEDMAEIAFNRIQLHGRETPEFCRSLPWPVIKALMVHDRPSTIELAERYQGLDLLADAFATDQPGGTGQTYDYSILAGLVRDRRVMVAGGLHPENVGDMVKRLKPWGVDVSSGVESAPGHKDAALMKYFILAVRLAETDD